MLSRFRFLILSQLAMTAFLYAQVFTKNDNSSDGLGSFDDPPPGLNVVLSRWICALFLHVSQKDEIETAFKIMKYSKIYTCE